LAKQLTLDLGHRPALGRDDFLVTDSNAAAVALVDQWPNWPSYGAVIVGPAGAGKTHLAEVWRSASHAIVVDAPDIDGDGVFAFADERAFVVENLSDCALNETALFHSLNHVRQNNAHVLLLARQWPLPNVTLPDLRSRLKALPVAEILPPDDALLRGVLVKLFSDRQIAVDELLVNYLVSRMPRSLDMARLLVERIDAAALEQRADVTRAFAGKVLAELESTDLP
jgi:chromosomal replication initiation ATPase DnaA